MASYEYTDLILDLGGVMFYYALAVDTPMALSPTVVKHILDSPCWHEFERGTFSEDECHQHILQMFGIEPKTWQEVIAMLKATLTPNYELGEAIKALKAQNPGLRVHAFSNISQPDFELLRPQVEKWGFFDTVVTSFEIGERKPDFSSYEKMLAQTKAPPKTSIMVDDRHENVITAQALGIRGVYFESTASVVSTLGNLLADPVARGMQYLHQNAKNLWCVSNTNVVAKDNVTQLLILECIGENGIVELNHDGSPLWHFFGQTPVFTDTNYPKDSDTTSIAHMVLDTPQADKKVAMDTILQYLTKDGLPLVCFDHTRPRCCLHICAGVLRFFYLNRRGHELTSTLHHLTRVLEHKAYELPSRYYIQPEWMMYHLSDLCARSSDRSLDNLRHILKKRLSQRMGCDKDIMGAGFRVVSAQGLGLELETMEADLQLLLDTQEPDGGWPTAWLWKYGKINVKQASRGLPTAMAIKAIRQYNELRSVSNGI